MSAFAKIGEWVIGFAFAVVPIAVIWHRYPNMPMLLLLFIFVWIAVGVKAVWCWMLSRRFPPSGAELRRKKKVFYDSLER